MRDEESIEAAMRAIANRYGRLDVLVNNAGGQFVAAARDITNKGFEAVIRNNLIGSWQMTRAAANHFMFDNGGSVVFVTAVTRTALTGFVHTAAARAGVTGVMNRMGATDDIAGAIIFLASKIGGFITGEELYVDGGETLHLAHDMRDMINPEMFANRKRGDGDE